MYQDLLEMERKLDWTMTRKRVEVQDAMARTPTVSTPQTLLAATVGEILGLMFLCLIADDADAPDIHEPHGLWPTLAERVGHACRDEL